MVLPWRWWLGLREVVLGFSKGRGFAASFSFTTPRPPFKGALVAALLCFAFGFVCKWSINVMLSSPTPIGDLGISE